MAHRARTGPPFQPGPSAREGLDTVEGLIQDVAPRTEEWGQPGGQELGRKQAGRHGFFLPSRTVVCVKFQTR